MRVSTPRLPTMCSARSIRHRLAMAENEEDDTKTTVDWDAELKKLNSKQVKGVSDAEVAVSKFKKQVDATLNKTLPIKVPSPKSLGRQLQAKDWKFWVIVLAGIGFVAALSGAISREELVVRDDTHTPAAAAAQQRGLLATASGDAAYIAATASTGSSSSNLHAAAATLGGGSVYFA